MMSSARHLHNIALIGFMGTGKSSVGRLLADQLHFDFLDTDELVESRAGKCISEIFSSDGEAAFRQHELEVVAALVARHKAIIATGGGVGASPVNLASLKEHALVVCLWASPERIWDRVRGQTHRPLLKDPDPLAKIRQLLAAREACYKQADVVMNTEAHSMTEVAQQVVLQFKQARSLYR
jgi:shikimate kinase